MKPAQYVAFDLDVFCLFAFPHADTSAEDGGRWVSSNGVPPHANMTGVEKDNAVAINIREKVVVDGDVLRANDGDSIRGVAGMCPIDHVRRNENIFDVTSLEMDAL